MNYTALFAEGFYQYDAAMKVKANGFNIDAVGILPLDHGFSLFAKAGVINAKLQSKLTIAEDPHYVHIAACPVSGCPVPLSYSDTTSSTDLKTLFGFGAAYNLNAHVTARAEVERYSKLGNKNSTGEGDVDLYSAGIAYNF